MPENEAIEVLKRVGCPIRWPTAQWLLCDVLDIIACNARFTLVALLDEGRLIQTSGGWLEVV